MEIFNTWQFNLFLYYICVVTFYQCYKLAVRDAHKDGAATVLLQSIAALTLIMLIPFFPMNFATSPFLWIMLVSACVFYALNDRLQTTIRKNLPVSTFSIIGQSSTVFLIIISILFLSEPIVLNRILGAILIIIANIFVFYKTRWNCDK